MGLDQYVTYRAIVFQTKPTIQNHPQYPSRKSGFLMYLLVQFCIKSSCCQVGAYLVWKSPCMSRALKAPQCHQEVQDFCKRVCMHICGPSYQSPKTLWADQRRRLTSTQTLNLLFCLCLHIYCLYLTSLKGCFHLPCYITSFGCSAHLTPVQPNQHSMTAQAHPSGKFDMQGLVRHTAMLMAW